VIINRIILQSHLVATAIRNTNLPSGEELARGCFPTVDSKEIGLSHIRQPERVHLKVTGFCGDEGL
jgi:hypothetical protein